MQLDHLVIPAKNGRIIAMVEVTNEATGAEVVQPRSGQGPGRRATS